LYSGTSLYLHLLIRATTRKHIKGGKNILRETNVSLFRGQKYNKQNIINNISKTLRGKVAARGDFAHSPP